MTIRARRGFTLIELLVVIAIIAVLIALLLPAVQAAREAARRSQCVNNFKQIGLALHNYHDVNNAFPIGRMGTGYSYTNASPDPNRRTWVMSILPGIEQGPLFNSINFSYSFYLPQNTTVIRSTINVYQCPSDTPSVASLSNQAYLRSKGNIAVNWGNSHYWQDEAGRDGTDPYSGPYGVVKFVSSPFYPNKSTGMRDFTDGTNNTLLVGEVIVGKETSASSDHRGDIWNDDYNCTMFMAYTTPNSPIPDQMGSNAVYCGQGTMNNPVCITAVPAFNAARSRHAGGVNILFGDGSVHFIKSSINPITWRALSTTMGGEVISSDQY